MIKRRADMTTRVVENVRGGNGHVAFLDLLKPDETLGKMRVCSLSTLEKGCSIGYHIHENETETFYIIEGDALYNDNGIEIEATAGDVLHVRSGESHAVANRGEGTLILLAAIVYA